jgi:hypothetical protein
VVDEKELDRRDDCATPTAEGRATTKRFIMKEFN